MTEVRKEILKNYLKSFGLPVSGTKLQLAMRIWDQTKTYTLQIQMAPRGTVSIGIALDLGEGYGEDNRTCQSTRN